MARGPKKHMKRLNAPKHWMLDKLGGIWAPRPSTGPHKMRECLPMSLVLRQRLKYSLTRRETQMICMRRLIAVDGKVRTDFNYPTGFMDVISIGKTEENFRLLYDTKGRFVLNKISSEAAKFKLCRVKAVAKGKKATIGVNREHNGQAGAIPYVVTHDGRTIKYPHPSIKVNDTVKFDISTGKIVDFAKFSVGNNAMITRGKNQGCVGVIVHIERHPGSFDIVHIKDKRGEDFATRLENVFVIGNGKESWVSLPKGKGVKTTIFEDRDAALKKKKN
jgi:small subunit ribosomal protein S4e